jgi:putative transposase
MDDLGSIAYARSLTPSSTSSKAAAPGGFCPTTSRLGTDWVEKALGWTAEIVRHPPKVAPQEVMKAWARELAKEGVTIEWQKLLPPTKDFRAFLPRRWVVERTFSWLGQNRRLSKDYERLCKTSEAFIHVAMTRLMVRRLVRV